MALAASLPATPPPTKQIFDVQIAHRRLSITNFLLNSTQYKWIRGLAYDPLPKY